MKLQQQDSGRQISPTQATHWDHEGFFWLNLLVKPLRCFLLLEHTQTGPIIATQLQHFPTQILQKQPRKQEKKDFLPALHTLHSWSTEFHLSCYYLQLTIGNYYSPPWWDTLIHMEKSNSYIFKSKINYLQIKTGEYRRLLCLCHYWSQCMLQNLDFLLMPLSTYLLSHCVSVKALNTLTSHSATVNTVHDIRPSTINSKFQALRKSHHLPIYLERPLPVHASIYFGISTCCTALQVTT